MSDPNPSSTLSPVRRYNPGITELSVQLIVMLATFMSNCISVPSSTDDDVAATSCSASISLPIVIIGTKCVYLNERGQPSDKYCEFPPLPSKCKMFYVGGYPGSMPQDDMQQLHHWIYVHHITSDGKEIDEDGMKAWITDQYKERHPDSPGISESELEYEVKSYTKYHKRDLIAKQLKPDVPHPSQCFESVRSLIDTHCTLQNKCCLVINYPSPDSGDRSSDPLIHDILTLSPRYILIIYESTGGSGSVHLQNWLGLYSYGGHRSYTADDTGFPPIKEVYEKYKLVYKHTEDVYGPSIFGPTWYEYSVILLARVDEDVSEMPELPETLSASK
jgi:hypothetical protein